MGGSITEIRLADGLVKGVGSRWISLVHCNGIVNLNKSFCGFILLPALRKSLNNCYQTPYNFSEFTHTGISLSYTSLETDKKSCIKVVQVKKNYILHPFLFALYPVLFLYSHNVDRVPFYETLRIIFLQEIFAGFLLVLLWVLFRNWYRSSLVVSLTVVLFTSFGHVYSYLSSQLLPHSVWSQVNVLAAIWAAAFILIGWWFLRILPYPEVLSSVSNAISITLILFPLLNISSFAILRLQQAQPDHQKLSVNSSHYINQRPPDIYYFILDEYGRHDVLNDYLSFDNSEFINFLNKRGFYLPENTHSNYPMTVLSVASSLNFQYLENHSDLSPEMQKVVTDNLIRMIKNNQTMDFLREKGYKVITFATASSFTEITNSDLYITPTNSIKGFEADYLNTTLFIIYAKEIFASQSRAIITEPFARLPALLQSDPDTPKIVFLHIPAAHAPYVFGSNGENVEPWAFDQSSLSDPSRSYAQSYREQVNYINKLVENAVDTILTHSKQDPIIILQGDHGSQSRLDWHSLENTCLEERLSILNAYYLPEVESHEIPANMTPVNTFRFIFNRYFGTSLELLEDKVYYSIISQPYRFYDVTDQLIECR